MRAYPSRPVAAVGAVVLDRDRVLLVKRAHEPLKGAWSLPGGVVEIGERLEVALVREVAEETGLAIDIGSMIEVVERIHAAPDGRVEFHYVIVDYACRPSEGLDPVPGSDAEDVRWVNVDDLESYKLTEQALAVIQKARELARPGFQA